MTDRARFAVAVVCCGWWAGCVPDLPPPDTVPASMQFDPTSVPPRVPQPINLVINPATGHIDFSVVGLDIPTDPAMCLTQTLISPAECEFDQYLESLDGF